MSTTKISLDNGNSAVNVRDLSDEQCESVLEQICASGDPATELTHNDLAPCTAREFVTRFCEYVTQRGETFTIG